MPLHDWDDHTGWDGFPLLWITHLFHDIKPRLPAADDVPAADRPGRHPGASGRDVHADRGRRLPDVMAPAPAAFLQTALQLASLGGGQVGEDALHVESFDPLLLAWCPPPAAAPFFAARVTPRDAPRIYL
jgi:hypothetical protein